jgi:four helix bundle protein
MEGRGYRDLMVWQRAMELAEVCYRAAELMSGVDRYGLPSQIERAASSIPANIAEEYGRTHRGDYLHHLPVARGSLFELGTHLILAVRIGRLQRKNAVRAWQLADEVSRILTALILSLNDAKPA